MCSGDVPIVHGEEQKRSAPEAEDGVLCDICVCALVCLCVRSLCALSLSLGCVCALRACVLFLCVCARARSVCAPCLPRVRAQCVSVCVLASVKRGSLNAERSVRMNTGSYERRVRPCSAERGSLNTASLCSLNPQFVFA